MESMGARVVRQPHHEIMESMADDRLSRLGMTYVPPFGDPLIVAGQGTIGLEILDELPETRTVIVPVGGGGLVSGIAMAIKAKREDVKVFGVQAEGAAPLVKSLSSGRPESIGDPKTIADGIASSMVFDYMFPLFEENLAGALTVSDQQIREAMKQLVMESHVIAEPAGASSLAGALRYRKDLVEPIVCVVSGGNADTRLLAELLTATG